MTQRNYKSVFKHIDLFLGYLNKHVLGKVNNKSIGQGPGTFSKN